MNESKPVYRVNKKYGWVYKVLRAFTVSGQAMLEVEARSSVDGHPIVTWFRPDEVSAPLDAARAARCFTELQRYA